MSVLLVWCTLYGEDVCRFDALACDEADEAMVINVLGVGWGFSMSRPVTTSQQPTVDLRECLCNVCMTFDERDKQVMFFCGDKFQ